MRNLKVNSRLLVLIGVLVMSISQMWATFTINGGTFYFDNSKTDWGQVALFVGKGGNDKYTNVYSMNKITNTKLYYYDMSSWGGATYIRFTGCTDWGSGSWGPENYNCSAGFTAAYTSDYTWNSSQHYLHTTSSGNDNATITPTHKGSTTGCIGSSKQTINVVVNGSTPGTAPADIDLESAYWTAYNAVTVSTTKNIRKNGTTVSDNYASAAYTAKTTLKVGTPNSGYYFLGWYDNSGNLLSSSTTYTYYPTSATTITARFETQRSVTVAANSNGTASPSSVTAGYYTASGNATATPNACYYFTNWSLPSGVTAASGYSSTSNPIKVNASENSKTITANFAHKYAYIEGRFHVTNASRNGSWTNTFSSGDWEESSTSIQFEFDNTNHWFYRHTYATPKELTTQISSQDPVFYVKTSTASGSLTNQASYWSANSQTLTAAGTANKKDLTNTGTFYNNRLKFNSTDESGYVVLYFNQSYIWYELEQTLKYDGNGNKGGSAPAGTVYYAKGTNATAASNTYTREGYTFTGWNTRADGGGTSYAAGASVPMNSNITLYAQWSANNKSVTLNLDGVAGAVLRGGVTSPITVTYDATTNMGQFSVVPGADGFLFDGFYTSQGGAGTQIIDKDGKWIKDVTGYTGHDGSGNATWKRDANVTLYAKWKRYYTLGHYPPKEFNPNSTSEGVGSVYVTFNSSTLTSYTAAFYYGYSLDGYYSKPHGEGGQMVITNLGALCNVNGVSDSIVNTSSKWIYTKLLNGGRLYPHWTARSYTITFNADDASRVGTATNVQTAVTVHYDNNDFSAATVQIPTLAGYTFGGYYTDHDGSGQQIVNAEGVWQSNKTGYLDPNGKWKYHTGNVTLYAKWTAKTYTLTFDAGANGGYLLGEAGEATMKDVIVTYGENYSVTGNVGYRVGYEFKGWFTAPSGGTQVTNDTRITTHSNHTIYAQYTERNYVYFYNNLGWSKVFVTYNAYWDETNGTGNKGRVYHQMQQIGTSNVYRDEIPAAIISDWSGTNGWIAFNDTQLDGGTGVPTSSGNYNNYNSGKIIHRRDFDSYATMFVPKAGAGVDFTKMTNGNYYCTSLTADKQDATNKDYRYIDNGYWTRYDDKESGYVLKGSWDSSHDYYFTRSYTEHADTTTVVLHLNASTNYTFKLYKHCRTSNHNNSWFSASTRPYTITSSNHTNIVFNSNWAGQYNGSDANVTITTTTEGDYTFKLACDKSTGVLTLSVDYPKAPEVRDHRLVYTWTPKGGSAHTWISPNKIIPNTARTPMSAFIHKPSNVTSNSLKLQRWNGSAWVDAYTITLTDALITKNGVYYIEPNRVGGSIESVKVEPYTGKYYLRTDATGGGWKDYSNPSFGNNSMTYSAYSLTQTLSDPYSHFYCVYVDNTNTSVAFTVATEWTPSITDTLKTDALVTGSNCHLPEAANVRFMWNSETNELHRAYLKSAQGENARFLVLRGKADDMIFKSNGDAIPAVSPLAKNELQFEDKGDWIYEIELQAKPASLACITAKFGGADRYLIGDGDVGGDNWETVLGGTGSTKYPMKGIYDFKTNRLMMMWTPPVGAITDHLKDVDMLWVRNGNNSASQINITTGSLTDVTVVGALEFKYNDLIGKVSSWNSYSRPLMKFMLSFPFDVNVSDIFGLNGAEYGREYIIQTYNGARRAEKGYYSLDGDFWEDLTVDSVMHANQGYSVIMDNDYMNNASKSIWEHKSTGSSIYLYFPATKKMDIPKNEETSTVTPHLSFDKPFAGGTKNHINTDSHWNMIGSPLFHDSYVKTTADNTDSKLLAAYYEWNSDDNTWGVEVDKLINPKDLTGSVGFPAMTSIIVQWNGTITWSTTATSYLRPAPKKEKGEVKNYLVRLDLIYNDIVTDKAYVQLSEDATEGYALCEDLNKIMNGNKSNIYLFADDYEVAYSQVPVQTDTIPVGVIIRRTGTYTFSMPTNFSGTITLIDKFDGTRTNLAIEDYTVDLTKGTINDRFELEINIHNAPTAIDGVEDGQGTLKDGKAHKYIENGQMYILQNGMIYDAQGKRVK